MEACGKDAVAAAGRNIDSVLAALDRAGVQVTDDGVRLKPRPHCFALVDSSYIFFSMHMFIFESHSPPAFLQFASLVAGD